MNEAVKLKRVARKGDKIFKQIRKIISTDPKLTETQRAQKLHQTNRCQYMNTSLLVFATSTRAAGAGIEQAVEAMKRVINIPYTPRVLKTDKNNSA